MVQCPNCLRTFIEDRLLVHLKSCTAENPHKIPVNAVKNETMVNAVSMKIPSATIGKSESKIGKIGEKTVRPKALMCYIW